MSMMPMTPMQGQMGPQQGMNGGAQTQDDMMLEYLLGVGALAPEQASILRQRKLVDELRSGAQVPENGRQVGRAYIARNPLEMLAPVAAQGLASWKENKANEADTQYKQKRIGLLEGLRAKTGAPQAANPAMDVPSQQQRGDY